MTKWIAEQFVQSQRNAPFESIAGTDHRARQRPCQSRREAALTPRASVFNLHDWTHIRCTSDDYQRVLREHGIECSEWSRQLLG